MVVGIGIFEFDINLSKSGDISPEFTLVVEEIGQNYIGEDFSTILEDKEKFRLFFSHTTGLDIKSEGKTLKNLIEGRFQSNANKYFSLRLNFFLLSYPITNHLIDTIVFGW